MEVEEILSQLIKIPSVNPPGGETRVAEYLKGLFDKAGIENEIIESSPGRGSFFAYLGKGEKSLLFLSHTDVVPAGEGWDFPPFSGEIKGGMVYGRGALDCKGLVAAEARAMLGLAKEPLSGRLIFAATADEEAGGAQGVKYLIQHHPQKLTADFAVNEGGEEPVEIGGRMAYFIQLGEKGPAWVHLTTRGVASHGSLPTLGDNAVVKMAEAVRRLAQYKPAIKIIPEVKALLQALAQGKGWGEITQENVDSFLDQWPDRSFAEYLRAVTRMTVSPNMIQGGSRPNIVPDKCETEVDIRILPGQSREYVLGELASLVGPQMEIELPNFTPPSFSPPSSPGYKLLESTIKEVVGRVQVFPYISSGATDSRFLRGVGISSYGITIMAPDYDQSIRKTYHARNERVEVKSLRLKTRLLHKLALNYLGKG